MDALKSHYGRLLGLDASWIVTNVDLNLAQKQVVISLEYVEDHVLCQDCGEKCPLRDHAPLRHWRHLDTVPFETVLEARVSRSPCDQCGVKTAAVPGRQAFTVHAAV